MRANGFSARGGRKKLDGRGVIYPLVKIEILQLFSFSCEKNIIEQRLHVFKIKIHPFVVPTNVTN